VLLLISGATQNVLQWRDHPNLGVLMTPRGNHSREYLLSTGLSWAADNDAFSGFNAAQFTAMLWRLRGVKGCKFVSLPDVVGDAKKTLAQFYQWHPVVHWFHSYPVALVAQDGLEHESIPWSLFEALFVGGSTTWKLSATASDIIKEAKRRGKWVHMGRVNSVPRIRYAQNLGCDSVDGSGYSINFSHVLNHLPVFETRQSRLVGF
jgi:hypothetical protein